MNDRDALMAAVVDRPEDDTPRLVLADWHDDNGEPDRAAYIRAAVAYDRIPDGDPRKREAATALYDAQRPTKKWWTWYGPGDRVYVRRWERGFVADISVSAATWLEFADAITAAHPVRRVRLTTRATPAELTEYYRSGRPTRFYRDADDGMWSFLWPGIAFTLPPPEPRYEPAAAGGAWRIEIRPGRVWADDIELPGMVEGHLSGVVSTAPPVPRAGDVIGPLDARAWDGRVYHVPRAVVTEVRVQLARWGPDVVEVEARTMGEFAEVTWTTRAGVSPFVTLEPRA